MQNTVPESESTSPPRTQRNPTWSRDELILALDLYFKHRPTIPSKSHPDVVRLSSLLNALPIHSSRPDAARFRNPNGVYMKLQNFARFDAERESKGLARGGQGERPIWDEFRHEQARLRSLAHSIIRVTESPEDLERLKTLPDEDDQGVVEGTVLLKLHRYRERNSALAKRKKERVLAETGRLVCEVCGFDFKDRYGSIGEGFAECHHRTPLAELNPKTTTRLSDLAVVCANCHRMIHRGSHVLAIDELRRIVKQQAS
jgi:5-methylcytosine-specific restriction protein A